MGAISYSPIIQSPFIDTLNYLKKSYFNKISYIDNTINKHFFQAEKINELTKKLQKYDTLQLKLQIYNNKLIDLYKENNESFASNPQFELVHANSYQKFGDFNRLWIDIPDYNASKIYGLLYNNFVAGIVINEHKKPLALLNRDIKSTYAVSIGKEKAPGVAHGNCGKTIVISFIPTWFNINIGDEVTTSGLDNIFFKGLKVGTVVSIKQLQGYQSAVIVPYFHSYEPNYFYMIRSLK